MLTINLNIHKQYLEEANELLAAGEFVKAQAVATVGLLALEIDRQELETKEAMVAIFEEEEDEDFDDCFFDCDDCAYADDCDGKGSSIDQ